MLGSGILFFVHLTLGRGGEITLCEERDVMIIKHKGRAKKGMYESTCMHL